ncbi:MAG: response regulator [Methylococcales bacterium]|nr:response regulator [Methylococcales bacterium]
MSTSPAPRQTLLIVDDAPENLRRLGEILAPHYAVKVASRGQTALAIAQMEPVPDLILLDILMPDMDGYQVLAELRQHPESMAIPVIFVSALDDTQDEAHGLSLGAVDYITKPLKPAIVLSRVKTHLELKHARDHIERQNQWLEAEIERRMRQNLMIQDVSLRALASLAEARDMETGAHILRTQGYVRLLGELLAQQPRFSQQLNAETIALYAKASPLHDIGKVGIPDAILHKPGKLNAEEWAIMQTHAQLGADAIWRAIAHEPDREGLLFLYTAMDIARYHHEQWDGSGYPEGLRGESIPLAARLMALADVFDALISKRVYKPAFTFDDAFALIEQGRGRHFDPTGVAVMLAHREAFIAIAERYRELPAQPAPKV